MLEQILIEPLRPGFRLAAKDSAADNGESHDHYG
jgi:hypothetical protein